LALFPILLIKVVADILEDVAIRIAVNQIFTEVLHDFVTPVFGNVIVEPPEKDFLITEFLHDILILIRLSEKDELRVLFKGELVGNVDLNKRLNLL
jgi:hypothetical protein